MANPLAGGGPSVGRAVANGSATALRSPAMCDGSVPRIALYTFMIAGTLSPLVSIVGAKLWPARATRVAVVSLALFVVAGIAGAFVLLC